MIEYIRYFFRHNEDGLTSLNMTLVRLALVLALVFAYKGRDRKDFLKILLGLGLLFQGLLIFWYAGDRDIFLVEGLPFYHCRVAQLMMAVSYFSGKEKWAKYFAWLGISGAFIAFMIPDPSPYLWPHITNLTYVGSHLILLMTGFMIILNTNHSLKLGEIFTYSFVLNSFIFLANFIFKANYGYLSSLPEGLDIDLSKPILFILITSLLTLGLSFLEIDLGKIYRKRFARI
ncbi:MAG: YwaF family protein [Anaerococcus sp.]|nr:YwaF family protein [Peptoniphilaceae bacterium]MDY3055323.1 YwaF family protein [Anaerococcus sp.]